MDDFHRFYYFGSVAFVVVFSYFRVDVIFAARSSLIPLSPHSNLFSS
jgi:hypothetical protein